MAGISFEKKTEPVETPVEGVVIDVTTTVAPAGETTVPVTQIAPPPVTAVVPAAPVAVVPANSPLDFDDDNIGFEDVILPRLNIVQKVGDLSNIFTPGEIVLNQSSVIHEPANKEKGKVGTGPLSLVVLGFRKRQFAEKVEGGDMGLLLNSELEIPKHGGTLDYKEWQNSLKESKVPGSTVKPLRYFQKLATAVALVQRPAHMDAQDSDNILFPYLCEGKYYALVLWSMKGTAYTHAAKKIFTHRKLGHLRGGYLKQGYTLTTKLEPFGTNFAFVPVLGVGAKTTPGFETFLRSEILGAD